MNNMINTNSVIKLTICLSATIYVIVGIGLNYFSYLNPGDGVFYISLADSLVDNGKLQDIATIPPHHHITYQNGIVYVIALLKVIFHSYWIIPYTVIISFLWSIAYYKCYILIFRLFNSHVLAALFLCVNFLQVETLVYSNSFYNESVYNPLLLLFMTHFLGISLFQREGAFRIKTIIAHQNQILQIIILILFLTLGIFFRNQHLTLLLSIMAYTLVFERKLFAKMAIVLVITGIFFYAYFFSIGKAISLDFIVNHIYSSLSGISTCSFIFIINQFIYYLYPQRLFGQCSNISVGFGIIGLIIVFYGMLQMRRRMGEIFYLVVIYIITTFLFILIITPPYFADNRYSGEGIQFLILLFTFGGLEGISSKFPKISIRILGLALTTFVICFFFMAYLHFYRINNNDSKKTFNKYSVVQTFKEMHQPRNFLIYATDYRLVYWYLKEPVCTVEPDQCAKLKGASIESPIVYIGDRNEFNESNYEWAGEYQIGSSLGIAVGTWGVYPIYKNSKK